MSGYRSRKKHYIQCLELWLLLLPLKIIQDFIWQRARGNVACSAIEVIAECLSSSLYKTPNNERCAENFYLIYVPFTSEQLRGSMQNPNSKLFDEKAKK